MNVSPLSGDMSVLDDGVVEVPVEALLDVGHVLDLGSAVQYSTVQYRTVPVAAVLLPVLPDPLVRDLVKPGDTILSSGLQY